MKSKLYFLLVFVFTVHPGFAQETESPEAAKDILTKAQKVAKEEGKNVFIGWHASWCGWCKLMDKNMHDESVKQYFDDNYVIVHLVVKESKDNKHLENPGAADILEKYHGDKVGIPFWVVLDEKGQLLADAFIRAEGVGMDEPGKNTGCPAQPEEVDHWIRVLKTTSDIPDEGLNTIANLFSKK